MRCTLPAIPILALAATSAPAQFTWIEPTPGMTSSSVSDLSSDGRTAAVSSWSDGPFVSHASFWSRDLGRVDFGIQPGVPGYTTAVGISGSGQYAVGGAANSTATNTDRLYRWSTGSGFENLGSLPGYQQVWANDVNFHGSAIVGYGQNGGGATVPTAAAFRWTPSGGVQSLGFLRPGSSFSEARAVSNDGNVVVGVSMPSYLIGVQESFRWTPGGGMQALRQETGSPFLDTYANGISGDGNTIVGSGYDPISNASRPFRWTEQTGMIDLGMPPGARSAGAGSTTPDGGLLLIGAAMPGGITESFLWTPGNGYVSWRDFMTSSGVTLPAEYSNFTVNAMSDDGTVFAGRAMLNGARRGFVVAVPAPTALLSLGVGVLALTRRRR